MVVMHGSTLSVMPDATEIAAYAELTHAPLCILSLDFTAAFDGISHTYRLRMLKKYGYSMKFIKLLSLLLLLLLLYFIMSLFSNLTLIRFNYTSSVNCHHAVIVVSEEINLNTWTEIVPEM
jgi:hypothetical protein